MGFSSWHVSHQRHLISLERGLEVQAVFFDLQKTFDSVHHRLLIEKLHHLEVPSYLIRWISSYLHNRVQQVGVLGELSPPNI